MDNLTSERFITTFNMHPGKEAVPKEDYTVNIASRRSQATKIARRPYELMLQKRMSRADLK
jgi:hypothetical protein